MRAVTTDSSGAYEIAGLYPGEYRLVVAKFEASLTGPRDATVTVRAGQIAENLDLAMRRLSAVTGAVRDAFGEPVESVTVQLWQRRSGGGRALLLPVNGVLPRQTDDRGRYRLFGVPPGTYYVVVSDEPPEPRLREPARAVSGPSTRVYYPGTATIAESVPVHVDADRDVAGTDILFEARALARVQGIALDASGRPLQWPVILKDSERSGFPTPAQRTAVVDADGTFRFLNVPPGDYVVQGIVRSGAIGRAAEFDMEYVTVTEGETPPVVLRTSSGSTLRGRIVADGDLAGEPLDRFGLSAHAADFDYVHVGDEEAQASVAEDGTFEMVSLHGSLYMTGSAPDGWWLQSVHIGAADAAYQPFSFRSADAPLDNATAVFADTGASLTGRVRREGNVPASEYSVLVFSTDRNRWWARSGHVKLARPNSEGVFRVETLPPGDYLLAALDTFDINTEWLDPELLAQLVPSAQRMTLREREQATIELDLIRRPR